MANVSDWKGFEKLVAKALGGKRRFRTMESFGKEAPDVYWPKEFRKAHPEVKTVAVECKKRKSINIHSTFAEAKLKYGRSGKCLILASKIPATRRGTAKWKKLRKKIRKKTGEKLKRRDFTSTLVTVELAFFQKLWRQWLYGGPYSSEDLQRARNED